MHLIKKPESNDFHHAFNQKDKVLSLLILRHQINYMYKTFYFTKMTVYVLTLCKI